MTRYYYLGPGNQPQGPILPTEFLSHGLNADSQVCPEGGTQWLPLRDVPGLVNYLQQSPVGNAPQAPYGGAPYGQGMPGSVPPPNYMVWAILTTILCCLPFGIVAIVKASQVNNLWMAGRTAEAMESSRAAKTWSIVAGASGFVGGVIYGIFLIFYGVALGSAY
ncbi:MAG: CD225/dispanin family protein [Muribaculaceae bacterium]|nr:CD225/dispanin family protein [Muribaculaceae bacterium]